MWCWDLKPDYKPGEVFWLLVLGAVYALGLVMPVSGFTRAQARDPEKIGIGRVQNGVMLDRVRGNLGVGHEIRGGAELLK